MLEYASLRFQNQGQYAKRAGIILPNYGIQLERAVIPLMNNLRKRPPGQTRQKSTYSAEKLLRTALELFASKGFASVTIKDIASAANVNTALIYYYFESKEHLFRAAIEFAIKTAIERYSELCERHADPVFLISEWFRNNLEMADLVRQLVKIMLDYAGSSEPIPSMEALIKQFYSVEQDQILAESIRRGMRSGVFRKVDAARTGRFVSVHLDGIMVASVIRSDFDMRKSITDLENVLWTYLDYDKADKQGGGPRKCPRRSRQRSV